MLARAAHFASALSNVGGILFSTPSCFPSGEQTVKMHQRVRPALSDCDSAVVGEFVGRRQLGVFSDPLSVM